MLQKNGTQKYLLGLEKTKINKRSVYNYSEVFWYFGVLESRHSIDAKDNNAALL